jgi:hypothetical protein
MVAEETPSGNRCATFWLPAGSAVSTYIWITASSTLVSRSVKPSEAMAQM